MLSIYCLASGGIEGESCFMKKKALLCIAAFVFVVFAVVLLCHRLYMPRNVAYGIVHRGANEYVLPEDTLDSLLAHLRMTFALKDSPSCGFDESYMITLWNAEHQLVSKLLIALDGGCGIFQIGDTHYYLEGKDDAREIIAKFLSSLDSNSAAAEK